MRAGWRLAAVVKNVPGADHLSDPALLLPVSAVTRIADSVVIPLFRPANRRQALEEAESLAASDFPALLDPTAVVPSRLSLGRGCYINAGCILGGAVRLGEFVFVNRAASLGHHCTIGDFASIGPGAVLCGQVVVGEAAFIGAGAIILPGHRIGPAAVVAAGAVVDRDVPAGTVFHPDRVVPQRPAR